MTGLDLARLLFDCAAAALDDGDKDAARAFMRLRCVIQDDPAYHARFSLRETLHGSDFPRTPLDGKG